MSMKAERFLSAFFISLEFARLVMKSFSFIGQKNNNCPTKYNKTLFSWVTRSNTTRLISEKLVIVGNNSFKFPI